MSTATVATSITTARITRAHSNVRSARPGSTGYPVSRYIVRVPARSVATPATTAVYRRRRALVALFLAAFLVSVAMMVGALAPSGRAAPAGADGLAGGQRTYLVQPGDTLWAVADLHRGAMAQADYVALLVEMNGGARIHAGELIALP